MQNTIVVVTGDHGEELLEHGRWGHGSAFVDEQIHVPLVMRIPGQSARVIETVTSHLDIVPSLLPAFGVTNPPADYALGARRGARRAAAHARDRQRMVGLRVHRARSTSRPFR